ncbi:MAG: NAD-dependent deacylase [Anaerolineales bacterium]|nr:NAD-dependent deacylase [Anaerolineae bacterium]PWB52116.1 MAG: NAD-dependent deacylase [Anaerolineales bacterium]
MKRSSSKITILTGSGISAESGLPTYRDMNGLWRNYAWEEVASPEGWLKNPALVLEFYNERRAAAWKAKPNAAHLAIGKLENYYDVVVITQNVDELHERGGSKYVIHVHGNLAYARSTRYPDLRYRIDGNPITLGQLGEDNCQLRPDVVWFGEEVLSLDESRLHVATADIVLVVGTSLAVFPFASLVFLARKDAEKCLVSLEMQAIPSGFNYYQGSAVTIVPALVDQWISAVESA